MAVASLRGAVVHSIFIPVLCLHTQLALYWHIIGHVTVPLLFDVDKTSESSKNLTYELFVEDAK